MPIMFRGLVSSRAAGQHLALLSTAAPSTGSQLLMPQPVQPQEALPQAPRTTVPPGIDFFPPIWNVWNGESPGARLARIEAVIKSVDLAFDNGVPAQKPECVPPPLPSFRERLADSHSQRTKSSQQEVQPWRIPEEVQRQLERSYESSLKRQNLSISAIISRKKDTENSQRELQPRGVFTEIQKLPTPPDDSRLERKITSACREEKTERSEPRGITLRLGNTSPDLPGAPDRENAPESHVPVEFDSCTTRWTGALLPGLQPDPVAASVLCTGWRPMWRESSDNGYGSDDSPEVMLRNKRRNSQHPAPSVLVSCCDPLDVDKRYNGADPQDDKLQNEPQNSGPPAQGVLVSAPDALDIELLNPYRDARDSGYESNDSPDGKIRNEQHTSHGHRPTSSASISSFDAVDGGNSSYRETGWVSAVGSGGGDVYTDGRNSGLGSGTLAQDRNRESRKRKGKAPASESSCSDSPYMSTKKRKRKRRAGPCSGYRCPFKVNDSTVDCGRTPNMCYSNMGELKTHLRRKHIRAKSCHICGARFGTDRELNRHLESERRCQSPTEPLASIYDGDLSHEQFLLEHPGVKWRDLYIGMLGVPPNMDMERCGRLNCRNGKATSGTDDRVDIETSSRVGSSERRRLDQQASTPGSSGSDPVVTLNVTHLRSMMQEVYAAAREETLATMQEVYAAAREETLAMMQQEIASRLAGILPATMRTNVTDELERVPGLPRYPNISSIPERQLEQYPLNQAMSDFEGRGQLAEHEEDPPSPGPTDDHWPAMAQAQGLGSAQGLSGSLQAFTEAPEASFDFTQPADGLSNFGFNNSVLQNRNAISETEPGSQWLDDWLLGGTLDAGTSTGHLGWYFREGANSLSTGMTDLPTRRHPHHFQLAPRNPRQGPDS